MLSEDHLVSVWILSNEISMRSVRSSALYKKMKSWWRECFDKHHFFGIYYVIRSAFCGLMWHDERVVDVARVCIGARNESCWWKRGLSSSGSLISAGKSVYELNADILQQASGRYCIPALKRALGGTYFKRGSSYDDFMNSILIRGNRKPKFNKPWRASKKIHHRSTRDPSKKKGKSCEI